MDETVARWLVSDEAAPHLAAAEAEADPSSLAAATRLRSRLDADRAAAVLEQAALRRRAAAKSGGRTLWWTRDGLEQATRPDVAAWRARRLVAAGATRVVDLGCGLGLDALAMRDAGLEVVAVERDPATAVLAAANLGVPVAVADAETYPLAAGDAVFCDPARRTSRGRSWDVSDLSPSWGFVSGLLGSGRVVAVKLGPGVPHRLLPDEAEVRWVSHAGDAVEAAVWAGPGTRAGRRGAVLLPAGDELDAGPLPPPGPLGRYVVEPDPAVIRSGAAGTLAADLGLHPVADHVAYLTGDTWSGSPFATGYEVLAVLPYDVRTLRRWVAAHDVGTLEIKKRGVDVDPAALRRRLRPTGAAHATWLLTPTTEGTKTLVVTRR